VNVERKWIIIASYYQLLSTHWRKKVRKMTSQAREK